LRRPDQTLLLIGGSGFFGKSFLDAYGRGLLAPWGIGRVIVLARSAMWLRATHPTLIGPGVELIDADIATVRDLPPADFVVHAASSSDACAYAADPSGERANILAATDTYCRIAARDHRHSRIVYTSSGAVYGQQPETLSHIAEDFTPGATDGLVTYKRDYAEAKRLSEAMLARLGEQGLAVSVARCFAFVGAHLPRDQHFAIGNFLADGMAGRPVRVATRKAVYRSYMHADDLVRWLMTIAAHATPACPVYNVGSDQAVTMGDLARLVAERFGVAAEVPAITDPTTDRYIPATDKARRELGLTLDYDLLAAIDAVSTCLASKAAA
jgi:nucleoside-diphosphate-sugar epimerase